MIRIRLGRETFAFDYGTLRWAAPDSPEGRLTARVLNSTLAAPALDRSQADPGFVAAQVARDALGAEIVELEYDDAPNRVEY